MKPAPIFSAEQIRQKLQTAGVQPTVQRVAICKYVLCEADHASAEQVKEWADQNLEHISLATVYNTLNTLVAAGMLRTFKLPHSGKVIYDNNTHDHYHFLDEESGNLYDIESTDISVKMKVPEQFQVNSLEIVLRGAVRRPSVGAVRRPSVGAVRRPRIKATGRSRKAN